MENDFLTRITGIIKKNLSNERFGVSELAREAGMSRSNLLRKIQKSTQLSASQYIRKVRLESAYDMLRRDSNSVSEIAYEVGFGSVSYFVKCFRDRYGYPPGEVGKNKAPETGSDGNPKSGILKSRIRLMAVLLVILIGAVSMMVIFNPFGIGQKHLEKSIAVLPFKDDSNDSSNLYFINGLMESILNDLQKMSDLRVISRTSVEKYRNLNKTIPEIARELDVSYIIEGSGQKIGDRIVLHIQLIEARRDNHLWGEQYARVAGDIFDLQAEIARKIADEIEVIITPEEEARIDKVPTENMEAYDYFLRGLDLINDPYRFDPVNAIPYFKGAIELDEGFARAYAGVAIAYYYLDENQVEKKYNEQINYYADKAMLLDSNLPQSLIAKALFYMNNGEYVEATGYFERALALHPNSDLVVAFMVDLYANHFPDTEKYLEYALRGIRMDIASYDSSIASINYLHIANAFVQAGFIKEAERYINRSIDYDPANLYSEYVKAYILYAKNRDLIQTRDLLKQTLQKDTNRLDVLQEMGKIFYYLRDYESAYFYYRKFTSVRESLNLDIYRTENAKIGLVFSRTGHTGEADRYFQMFREYAENDPSIYRHSHLAMYNSFMGNTDQAIEHLKRFSEEAHYHFWTVLFIPIEPLFDNVNNQPEYRQLMENIETKFWSWHEQIRSSLEGKDLI
jgi:TolB-like protein/AraC-like DNA-binding protein/Tfp pilus assembly protein PilF